MNNEQVVQNYSTLLCVSYSLAGDPGMFGRPTAAHAGKGCCTPGAI